MDERTLGHLFESKVAIVSGASTEPRIGTATARRLAMEGTSVVINARSESRLRAAENSLRDEGLAVIACAGAAEVPSTSARLVDSAIERFGGIDLLVNAVDGAPFVGSALTLTEQDLMGTISMNTWPALSLVQEAMARGLADGGGAIVNISSGPRRRRLRRWLPMPRPSRPSMH